jgi:hypothetical protein
LLTTIVLVPVLPAAAVVVAWWMLDFDMPEVVIPSLRPASAPDSFGTALALGPWTIGLLLLLIGGYGLYSWPTGEETTKNLRSEGGWDSVTRPTRFKAGSGAQTSS